MSTLPLLHRLMLDPGQARGLDAAGWDLLVRQGRAANLLAELGARLEGRAGVPEAPARHVEAARRIAVRQRQATLHELDCVARALAGVDAPVVLLKGAAYLALDLPFARHRLFGDVDLLVPADRLGAAESALLVHGWHFENLDPYDQRYYRRWMHELPPLVHRQRGTVLDLHHSLLPRTARIAIDSRALFADLVPLPRWPGLHVLPPAAMLAHSATHLMQEGELGNGLRDLFDIDALVRHFGAAPGFWDDLAARSRAIGVARLVQQALVLAARQLGTPVPQAVCAAAPRDPAARLTRALHARALAPVHVSCRQPARRLAWALLYLRSHWLRMPTGLLLRHLSRKAWRRISGREAREAEQRQTVEGGTAG